MHITVRIHTLFAFVAGVALTVAAAFVFAPWSAGAAPGDDDATLVPITACRLIDTRDAFRVGTGSAMSAGETRVLAAHGSNGNCTIPTDATGLVLNVTAVGATLPTFLTIWDDGDRPTASSLNPTPGAPPTPNAVTTKLATDGSFRLFNLQGTVEVIIDVTGYFTDTSLDEIAERLDSLEAAGEHLRRAVGYKFASSGEFNGSRSGTGNTATDTPVGVQVRIGICDESVSDCIELATPTLTSPAAVRFDATNTPRWATIVDRLTNGVPNGIERAELPVNSLGDPTFSPLASVAPDTRIFVNDQASAHPAFEDLDGAEIASIVIDVSRLEFNSSPNVFPTPWDYDSTFEIVVEMPGAPPLD